MPGFPLVNFSVVWVSSLLPLRSSSSCGQDPYHFPPRPTLLSIEADTVASQSSAASSGISHQALLSRTHRETAQWRPFLETLYCHLLDVVVITILIHNHPGVKGTLALFCARCAQPEARDAKTPLDRLLVGQESWSHQKEATLPAPTLHTTPGRFSPLSAVCPLTSDSLSSIGSWLQIQLTCGVSPESPAPCQETKPLKGSYSVLVSEWMNEWMNDLWKEC